jgi:hypothetical protein
MPSEGGAEKWVLPAHDKLQKGKKLMLIILDGWGEQIADQFNAIAVAKTPIMDHLKTVRNKDFSTSQCPPTPSSSIICLSASSSDGFQYSSSSFAISLLLEDCQFCALFCFSHTKFCHLWFDGG